MPYQPQFAFIASTGRTATTLITKILAELDDVTALHEGHYLEDKKSPILPPINMEHRKAWYDENFRDHLVNSKRAPSILEDVLKKTGHQNLVDVAYYNAALVENLAALHPKANILMIVRRCEPFVRSATTIIGEDLMPVGWPDANKELSPREKFIELGRLKPHKTWSSYETWSDFTAIEKNIWLWKHTNQSMWRTYQNADKNRVHILQYEQLAEQPELFWKNLLKALNLYNEHTLLSCLHKCSKKENAKMGGYQIPTADAWTPAEQAALKQAQLLENLIYEP